MFLSKLFNKIKNKKGQEFLIPSNNSSSIIPYSNVNISCEGFYYIVDIREDCDFQRLMASLCSDDDVNIINSISTGILLDKDFIIMKKKIFVFSFENVIYNICFKENSISINEKTFL